MKNRWMTGWCVVGAAICLCGAWPNPIWATMPEVYITPQVIEVGLAPKEGTETASHATMRCTVKSLLGTLKDIRVAITASGDIRADLPALSVDRLDEGQSAAVEFLIEKGAAPIGEAGSFIRAYVKYEPDYDALVQYVRSHVAEYPNEYEREQLLMQIGIKRAESPTSDWSGRYSFY